MDIAAVRRILAEHTSPSFDRETVEGLIAMIDQFPRRERDLLEANNRYLERARSAERLLAGGGSCVGRRVRKVSGYKFPGAIVAQFLNLAGEPRLVVEATGEDYAGMLHIYLPGQVAFTDDVPAECRKPEGQS